MAFSPSLLPQGVNSYSDLVRYEEIRVATRYAAGASLALLIYDYFCTLELEIAHIWNAKPRLTLSNVLFTINRYLPIARSIITVYFALAPPSTPKKCTRMTDIISWSQMLCVGVVEVLMLLRAWAIWGRRRSVGIVLLVVYISAVIATVTVVKVNLKPIPGVVELPPPASLPCDRPSPSKYVAAYSIALAVEFVSFCFMFSRVAFISKDVKRDVPIVKALRVQGAYYFMAVISAMMFTVFSGYIDVLARPVAFSGLASTITSIACTRVILALKGLFLKADESTALPVSTVDGSTTAASTIEDSRKSQDQRPRCSTSTQTVQDPPNMTVLGIQRLHVSNGRHDDRWRVRQQL